jgi:uncharacterized protein (DUF2336 family)
MAGQEIDMTARTKLHDLIELAQEPSSTRRRQLLREVTDLFFTGADNSQPAQMALFDDVMGQLAGEMEEVVRAELSDRIAEVTHPPRKLLMTLVNDSIEVAAPLLARSPALSDDDLITLAQTKDQEHLRAISRRDQVSEAVSDVIVDRGDDDTLGTLLRNEQAVLSRAAHEAVIDRAAINPDLHHVVVKRQSVPIDLLNEMYFMVEAKLRDEILAKNAAMDPAQLDAALETGRKRVAFRDGALPPDFDEAEAAIKAQQAAGSIGPSTLAAYLRNGETTKFLVALALQADIDFHTARRILEKRELDALAIVCKAANFDRTLFLTFAVLVLGREADAMGRAREYGQLYNELTKDVANRTIRFWRMRRNTGDVAVA